ncbi:MAG: Holliday junction branch migration protein RuvA [Holophagaceae bacterium]|jgi:Holliday junction DNA helicase RuvA
MIGLVKGTLFSKQTHQAIIECAGVGYVCSISSSTFAHLPPEGSSVLLYTELVVRENDISLVGFYSLEEKELYMKLIQVDGIGTKLALDILGSQSYGELIRAIQARNIDYLVSIKGIGKKTAEKICFQLSEKLGGISGLHGILESSLSSPLEKDLKSALINLGYRDDAIRQAINQIRALDSAPSLEESIKLVLRKDSKK